MTAPDGTGQIATNSRRNTRKSRPASHGKERPGRATSPASNGAGGGYEFIFEMDCDFSHNPDDIPAFLEAAKDADLVLGYATSAASASSTGRGAGHV